jgi:HK97 family phage prohead protease
MEYKGCLSEIKDLTESGTVQFYASVFGNKDFGGDVIEAGAFRKTLNENFKNIRHFKHHNPSQMVGVIKEMVEDSHGLLVTSKLILDTQLGKETYAEYKAMADAGKSLDHSIGFKTIKYENDNLAEIRRLKELKLMEVSTLTEWGMNPLAKTVSVKALEQMDLNMLFTEQKYIDLLLNCKFTDAKLANLEQIKMHIDSLILSRLPDTQKIQPIVQRLNIENINFNL